MSAETELVAIGLSLLGIIAGTWTCLYRINKKLDRLLSLAPKPPEKEKDTNHTNGIQSNNQDSFTNTVRCYVKKSINNLVKQISFKDKKRNWFDIFH
jgi:ubiquitin-protein ligase